MRRITDAEETRPIPLAQPINLNRQKFDRLPVVKFADSADMAAFRASIAKVAALECDILVTPHPSASDMIKRMAARSLEQLPLGRG